MTSLLRFVERTPNLFDQAQRAGPNASILTKTRPRASKAAIGRAARSSVPALIAEPQWETPIGINSSSIVSLGASPRPLKR
jgi:hypothetical protein